MDSPILWLSDHPTLSDRGNRDGESRPIVIRTSDIVGLGVTGMDSPVLWLSDHQTLPDRGNRN
jgi:hypothetical protein